MDLLMHIFSGAAAGTVVAACAGGRPARRVGIVAAGALGGAVPDVDAVSMWSHFDATFGRLFGLRHTGREIYGGTWWYSHHAFFHSLAAAVLLAFLLGLGSYMFYRLRGGRHALADYFKAHALVAAAFMAGYAAHLLGDLPTPASVWGGVRMFWPVRGYVGGTGSIWWWNNYDIFLIVAGCALINTALLLALRKSRRAVAALAALSLILIVVQTGTRQYSYAYRGNTGRYAQMEAESKAEQRRILGRRLYRHMEWLDDKLPINF